MSHDQSIAQDRIAANCAPFLTVPAAAKLGRLAAALGRSRRLLCWPRRPGLSTYLGPFQVRTKSVECRKTLRNNDKRRKTSGQVRPEIELLTRAFAGA